jgi:hypothetical protein
MSKAQIYVIYDGEAVREGSMDVLDLAPALLAMGELCQRANKVINGGESEVSVHVKADFQRGSFGVELEVIQTFLVQAKGLLLGDDLKAAKEIIYILFGSGSVIGLYKWLKGRKEKEAKPLEDGNIRIQVQGDGNNSIEINHNVYKVFKDTQVQKAVDGVLKPLRREEGIDKFEVRTDNQIIERVDKEEAKQLASENDDIDDDSLETTIVPDTSRIAALEIVKLSFKDDNKWVFSDGSGGTINADIADEEFLDKLNKREVLFGKGDTLKVKILTKTSEKGGKLHTTHTITKVEKIIPPEQLKLFPK